MSIEHTRALVAAACAIPGVREKLPAEWFWPHCPTCGESCDYSTAPERNNESVIICIKCSADVPAPELRFEPDTEAGSPHMIWGPDFADERNLWALLRLADAVNATSLAASVGGNPLDNSNPDRKFYADFMSKEGWREGYGPTRTAACIAAIESAIGVAHAVH